MRRFHYSWLICCCCTLALFCTLGITYSTFSVYSPYIMETLHITHTQSSALFTIRNLASIPAMSLLLPLYYRKISIRTGLAVVIISISAAFVIMALSTQYLIYCAAMVLCGAAYGLGGMIPVSILIDRWFCTHKGFALGLCASGSGIAAIIVPLAATKLLETFSLRITFFCIAAFSLALAAVVFLTLRDTPEAMGMQPLGTESRTTSGNITVARGYSNSQILIMTLGIFLLGAVSQSGFFHISVHYTTEGFAPESIARLLSIGGLCGTIGKLLYGRIVDRFGVFRSGYFFFAFTVIGWLLCCFANTGSMPLAALAVLFLNVGLVLTTVGLSVFAKAVSSEETYEKVLKNFQSASSIGGLIFTSVPGMIADASGHYTATFVIAAAVTAISAFIVWRVNHTCHSST